MVRGMIGIGVDVADVDGVECWCGVLELNKVKMQWRRMFVKKMMIRKENEGWK